MATLTFQGRVTKDAELETTQSGTTYARINFVYTYGMKKQGEQYKPSQFFQATLWGQQAERMIDWLVKGSRFLVVADDVNVRSYTKNNGEAAYSLEGRILKIEFLNTGESQGQGNDQQPRQAPQQQQQAPRQQPNAYEQQSRGGGLAEPDDIPFNQMGGRKGHYL